MAATIITIANQKGGVGKTTTTMNLGVALAQSGFRVLLIDGDPQANLTSYLGVVPGEEPYLNLRTLDEVYLSKRPVDAQSRKLYIATTGEGVDLIPSDQRLSAVDYYLMSRGDREMVLHRFLSALEDDYEFILIDTPPSLNLLTQNALCAAHYVLVPVQPEFFSLEGIVKIRDAIEDTRSRWNNKLSILGILATQVSHRRKLTQEVLDTLKTELGDLIFNSMIHDNSAVTESSGHATSVIRYDRSSRGAKDYLSAAVEIATRLGLQTRLKTKKENTDGHQITETRTQSI
ncbi:ParA family protein [Bdellovibrionota bacterium FG-2]